MAKISSPPPPPRPSPGSRRPSRVDVPKAQRVVRGGLSGTESNETSDAGDASPTMGELLSKERELAQDLRSDAPQETPWDDEQLEAEQRERNEDVRASRDRSRSKRDPTDSGRAGAARARPGTSQPTRPRHPAADGFELGNATVRQSPPASRGPALSGKPSLTSSLHVLNDAKEPGVLFREHGRDGRSEEDEDPELAEAVEEAIRMLFGVPGIHRIGPGQDEAGTPVVLVSVTRGFGESSLRKVPERVHRFRTLVALPYELLPLRRE